LDNEPDVARVVYSIKAVLMLIYMGSSTFKIFANDESLIKKFVPQEPINP